MASDETFQIETDQTSQRSQWASHTAWFGFLCAAWIVFEMTADPALVIVVACSKFGWSDYCTGRWLRKSDPYRMRGLTCSLFYRASSAWKVTVTAFLAMFAIVPLAAMVDQPQQQQPPLAEFLATALLCMVGFALTSFTTFRAIRLARRKKLKVWVDSTVAQSRKEDVWPPQPYGVNRVGRLIVTSLLMPTIVATVLMIVLFAQLAPVGNGQPVFAVGVGVLAPIMAAVLLLVGYDRLKRTVAASSPEECWNPNDDTVFTRGENPATEHEVWNPFEANYGNR